MLGKGLWRCGLGSSISNVSVGCGWRERRGSIEDPGRYNNAVEVILLLVPNDGFHSSEIKSCMRR